MVDKEKLLDGYERLNKHELIDACVLIEHDIDVDRLVSEVTGIPKKAWPGPANRLGVHRHAQAIFLRDYAPLQRIRKPIEDREILDTLPYIRSLIRSIKQVSVGKMETLREDLISFMSSFGVLLTNADTQFIRHSNKVNCGNHDPYRNYYDADLEALIRSKDAMIFDKYTY